MGLTSLKSPIRLAVMMVALLSLAAAASAQNTELVNGGFDGGTNSRGEPRGWHTHLTGVVAVPEYENPEQKEGRTGRTRFRCGCGEFWSGAVRPWTLMKCPHCGHVNTGIFDSGSKYFENHKHVQLVDGKRGRGLGFDIPPSVGKSQGVRALSDLIKADRRGYVIKFDAIADGAHIRVFVEGFRRMTGDQESRRWAKSLEEGVLKHTTSSRLKRVYRKQVNVGGPDDWKHHAEALVPPKRYRFDYLMVNLYAYGVGQAAFDNVVLRPMTDAEVRRYIRQNPGDKDRFKR